MQFGKFMEFVNTDLNPTGDYKWLSIWDDGLELADRDMVWRPVGECAICEKRFSNADEMHYDEVNRIVVCEEHRGEKP
jgi:hypothetical protein